MFKNIPRARILKIVTISCTATAGADTSAKVIIWAQMSARFDGVKVSSVSGT